jgi:hypothetical protein
MSGKTPFNLGHNAGTVPGLTGPKTLQLRRTTFEARTSPSTFSGCPLSLLFCNPVRIPTFICNKVQSYTMLLQQVYVLTVSRTTSKHGSALPVPNPGVRVEGHKMIAF